MVDFQPVDILMVDDDELDVELFRRALGKRRFANRLIWARDGVEALEVLRGTSRKSVSNEVIVLLDINMPRMNGLEFLDAVRADEALKTLTIFVMTTSKNEQDIYQANQHSVAGYIVKSDLGKAFANSIGRLNQYLHVKD